MVESIHGLSSSSNDQEGSVYVSAFNETTHVRKSTTHARHRGGYAVMCDVIAVDVTTQSVMIKLEVGHFMQPLLSVVSLRCCIASFCPPGILHALQ